MIVYNTTFHADPSVAGELLQWLRDEYIKSALATGIFSSHMLCRLMLPPSPDGCDVSSFALHLKAESPEAVAQWTSHDELSRLESDMHRRWGEKALFFSTMMEEI